MIDDDSFPSLTAVQQDLLDRLTSEIADETRQVLVDCDDLAETMSVASVEVHDAIAVLRRQGHLLADDQIFLDTDRFVTVVVAPDDPTEPVPGLESFFLCDELRLDPEVDFITQIEQGWVPPDHIATKLGLEPGVPLRDQSERMQPHVDEMADQAGRDLVRRIEEWRRGDG